MNFTGYDNAYFEVNNKFIFKKFFNFLILYIL